MCGVVAVRYSVLSANGPLEPPWAGSVWRPKRLVRRLGHDGNGGDQEEHFQPGGSGGGLGCLVFGWCCSSAVRCLHCAGVCFSLMGVLCGLTRSAISGTAVDTHVRLVVLASGVERGALGAVCIVLSELYPAPTVISAECPLCGRSVNELGPGMSGSAVLPGPGSCVNSGSSSLYMYGVSLLTGSSALIGVVVRCPLRRSSFEGRFFPSLICEAAGNIMCGL